jgi:hypothetical protein
MKTNDYNRFKFKKGNRPLNNALVKRLVFSIQSSNLTKCFPVVVNNKFEILDGQHRFTACNQIGSPIYYEVYDGNLSDLDLIWFLNSNQKTWTLNEFVALCSEAGMENYKRLLKVAENRGVTANIVANLAGQQMNIKNKKLKFDRFDAIKIDNVLADAELFNPAINKTWRFLKAFNHLTKAPDYHKVAFPEASPEIYKFKKQPSSREYLIALVKVYQKVTNQTIDIKLSELEKV